MKAVRYQHPKDSRKLTASKVRGMKLSGSPLAPFAEWCLRNRQYERAARIMGDTTPNQPAPRRRTTPAQARARIDQLARQIGADQQPAQPRRRSIMDFSQPAMQTYSVSTRP